MTDLGLYLIVGFVIFISLVVMFFLKKINFYIKKILDVEKKLDIQLKNRWLLISNLVNIMKPSIEKSKCLEDIIVLKNRIYDNMDFSKKVLVGNQIDKKILELISLNSNNKKLRFNIEFKRLNVELNNIDCEIKKLLDNYNQIVKIYNNYIDKFLYRFISKKIGYKKWVELDNNMECGEM